MAGKKGFVTGIIISGFQINMIGQFTVRSSLETDTHSRPDANKDEWNLK